MQRLRSFLRNIPGMSLIEKPLALRERLYRYAPIPLAALLFAGAVFAKGRYDRAQALQHYRAESEQALNEQKGKIEEILRELYQGIRTVSLLPGVRNLDRSGQNLNADAAQSIIQIYKNMNENLSVSEVYIVPYPFNPESIDPATGGLQEPILMFDEEAVEKPRPPKTLLKNAAEAEKQKEVEIYEYRVLREQLNRFATAHPHQTNALTEVPVLDSREVLTCDNTEFNKTHADDDRKGRVFSVPFYDAQGHLKGSVAAVVRSNVLKKLLPQHFALLPGSHDHLLTSDVPGQERESAAPASEGRADASLLYSGVRKLVFAENAEPWTLWVGHPDDEFNKSGDARAIRNFCIAGYAVAVLAAAAGLWIQSILRRNLRLMQEHRDELEHSVAARTLQLQDALREIEAAQAVRELQAREREAAGEVERARLQADADRRSLIEQTAQQFESRVRTIVETLEASSQQLNETSEHMCTLSTQAGSGAADAAAESRSMSEHVRSAATAVEELSESAIGAAGQTARSAELVRETLQRVNAARSTSEGLVETNRGISLTLDLINDIAFRINMLAINAAVEAAHAGASGRGFAVVAEEVKALAGQTRTAIEEIVEQIRLMQIRSREMTGAFDQVKQAVEHIDELTGSVAGTVLQQQQTSRALAAKMEAAAGTTAHVARNIEGVTEASETAEAAARRVLDAAKALSDEAHDLRVELDAFLHRLRAA